MGALDEALAFALLAFVCFMIAYVEVFPECMRDPVSNVQTALIPALRVYLTLCELAVSILAVVLITANFYLWPQDSKPRLLLFCWAFALAFALLPFVTVSYWRLPAVRNDRVNRTYFELIADWTMSDSVNALGSFTGSICSLLLSMFFLRWPRYPVVEQAEAPMVAAQPWTGCQKVDNEKFLLLV